MNLGPVSAESRLEELIGRLLTAAEASLAAGDVESARSTVEEVRAVSPDDRRAIDLLGRVVRSQRAPGGERVLMTVLFSDLVDSTALAERVEPEVMRDILGAYRSAASGAVERFGGQILQWLGDGVLAVFGYHRVFEDGAKRGVSAALNLVGEWTSARSELRRRLGVETDARVGVHTGVVVVADVGQDTTWGDRDSIVGSAPNLTARIQSEAAPGTVVISDVTQQLVEADFYIRSLGLRHLKGITRAVEVFAVEGERDVGDRLGAARYRRAGLVGRDEPRAHLLETWEEVRSTVQEESGGGLAVLIYGEAGIGKSRLAAEVREHVVRTGASAIEAGCLAYHVSIPLWPIGRMMERVVSTVGAERRDVLSGLIDHLLGLNFDVAEVVPLFAPLMGIEKPIGFAMLELEPAALLDRTLKRLTDWLSRLSRDQPVLFVVEDLHWADPSTLALMSRLVDGVPRGLLVVITTRDSQTLAWRDRVLDVSLDRLGAEAAASLVDQLVGQSGLSEDSRASIISRAEGIPLFIEELTLSAVANEGADLLPLRLHELLAARLKAQGLDLRVAQVAATVGSTFDDSIVTEVLDHDRDRVVGSLEDLGAAGIIESTDGDVGTGGYRFRHALLRDAAYQTQILELRSDTHGRIAKALQRARGDAALIGQHFDLANDIDRAVPEYVTAAQTAQARGAHAEATHLLSRVVELLDPLPTSEERDVRLLTARLLRALSMSAVEGYAAEGVRADHREVEALIERLGSRPEVLPALLATWVTWFTSGDLHTSGRLCGRLLRMVSDPTYSWFEPEARACAGFQSLHQGDLNNARVELDRAIAGFDQRPDDQKVSWLWPLPHDPIAITATGVARVKALQGDAASQDWEQTATDRAEQVGFPGRPITLAFIKVYGAWIRRLLGEDQTVRTLGAEVVAIGREHGSAYWERLGSVYVAAPSLEDEPSPEFIEQTIAQLRAMGHGLGIAGDLTHAAGLHARRGEVPRALKVIDEAIHVARSNGELVHLPEALRQRAGYRQQLDPVAADIGADLLEALRLAERQHSTLLAWRIAQDIAALPATVRPDHWRVLLDAARPPLANKAAQVDD